MASAVAVAADAARSPIQNNLGEDNDVPGVVTSGIYSKDEEIPGVNGEPAPELDESDEDLPANPLRGQKRSRRPNGDAEEDGVEGVGDDDLFGDDENGAGKAEKPIRTLDDDELDSGDDLERGDRAQEEEAPAEYITQEKTTMDLEYPRLPGPEPSDGEMYLLRLPPFMSVEPHAWDHTTFQPPHNEHHQHGTKMDSNTFSAYKTALTTMRWRHSPSNPSQLQSNARILRWSDGSLTLQLASDPTTQYDIDSKSIAPPQRNPVKPTPNSTHGAKYDRRHETFTYLFRPYEENGTMVATNRITAGLTIKQSASNEDDAIEQLKSSLAAAANASKVKDATGEIALDEDPEKGKKAAEQMMRERDKADKKRKAAIDRENSRADRALGRVGLGRDRFGGLNASMLEDEDEDEEGGRSRPAGGKTKRPKPRRRRNSEYSEDEDFGRKRFSREDEYDEEDDFLAPSDEEEVVEDDEDEDDGIVEDRAKGRDKTPKRAREDDDEADAEGDEEEVEVPQVARGKKRRVVDEDEDDE